MGEQRGDRVPAMIDNKEFPHTYSICGSFTGWKCQRLEPSDKKHGLYSVTARIGVTGQEEFQFMVDGDQRQLIYPEVPKATKTTIPVLGPDDEGSENAWLISAPTGEHVRIELLVLDARISVTVISSTKGKKTWHSVKVKGSSALEMGDT